MAMTIKDIEYYKQNPLEAIDQIRFCAFDCPAGDLEDNVAFKALMEFVNYAVDKLSPKTDCRDKKCTECDGECFLEDDKPSDMVQQPDHYRHGKYEVIDEMLIVFGPKKTFDFCILNSWKYRARAPFKGKMEEDMEKSSRYLEMAKQIVDTYEEIGYESIRLIKED